jgi:hypothetical protein
MSGLAQFEWNKKGKLFTAANQSGATVTLINTSTTTGFVLSNPWGSGKNLAIVTAGFQFTTVPAATSTVWLATSVAPSPVAHATTTGLTIYQADGSGANTLSVARAYSASTTPNLPVYTRCIGYSPTTPATTGGLCMRDYVEGALILVPGSYVQISYLGAAPVGMADMQWIEYVPGQE